MILLSFIVLFAAAVRLYSISALGFWTDELCSLSDAHGWGLSLARLPGTGIIKPGSDPTRISDARPFSDVLPGIAHDDAHPPLYFLLLRLWEDCFGDTEAVVRGLSVIFSVAAIVLLYFAAAERHSASAALCACLLMAVAGPQIEFAQEARNYMMLEAISLAAAVMLLRIERLGPSPLRLVAFLVIALAMLMTHYFAVAIFAAMGLYALLWMRGRTRVSVLVVLWAAMGAFGILWGAMLVKQLPIFSIAHQWLIDRGPGHGAREAADLLRLPARFLFEADDSAVFNRIAIFVGVCWIPVLLALRQPSLRLWSVWIILVVAMVGGSDLAQSTTQLRLIRFTLAATPPFYLIIAASFRRPSWRYAPVAIAVLLAIIALPMAYLPPWKVDFRTPAEFIDRRIGADDALVFAGADQGDSLLAVTYASFRRNLKKAPETIGVFNGPADIQSLEQLKKCRQVWVIWMWQKRGIGEVLPGFTILESGEIPYFAEIFRGTFKVDVPPLPL